MSADEKDTRDITSSGSSDSRAPSGNVDAAWKYLNDHRDAGVDTSSVDIDALRRKIDWRIVPLMFGCYTMQFLDKVILNVRLSPRAPVAGRFVLRRGFSLDGRVEI